MLGVWGWKFIRKGYLIAVRQVRILHLLHQDSIKAALWVNSQKTKWHSQCLITFSEVDETQLWPGNASNKILNVFFYISYITVILTFWNCDTCWRHLDGANRHQQYFICYFLSFLCLFHSFCKNSVIVESYEPRPDLNVNILQTIMLSCFNVFLSMSFTSQSLRAFTV